MTYIRPRKDARVVEWNSLENCLTRKGNEGSNPSLSARADNLVFKTEYPLFLS
jgi:hypothetical protein